MPSTNRRKAQGSSATRPAAEAKPLRDLAAGSVVGLIGLIRLSSIAALVFVGNMSYFLPSGLALFLAGACIMALLGAWRGSCRTAITAPQDAPCVLLAVLGAGLMHGVGRGTAFHTTVAAMILATAVTGLILLIFGFARIGSLLRFIPAPIICGFMAAIAGMMAAGAGAMLANLPIDLAALPQLWEVDRLWSWLPGCALALLLWWGGKRWPGTLVMPLLLLFAITGFYALLTLTGVSLDSAAQRGWLLGPFDESAPRYPLPWHSLSEARWSAIGRDIWLLALVPAAAVFAMLLNTTGLQRITDDEVDANKDMRAMGLANLGGALVGSAPGFPSLALTRIGQHLGARGPWVGIGVALVTGLALLIGTSWLRYLPRAVVGGLLLAVALDMLHSQVWQRREELFQKRNAVVLLVVSAGVALVGLLGVALG